MLQPDQEILSIVVDEAKSTFLGQAIASSTSSPSLNFYPATTSESCLNPCSFLQPFSASVNADLNLPVFADEKLPVSRP